MQMPEETADEEMPPRLLSGLSVNNDFKDRRRTAEEVKISSQHLLCICIDITAFLF